MKMMKLLKRGTLLLACLMVFITVTQPLTVTAATYTRTRYNTEDPADGTSTETITDANITLSGDYALKIQNGLLKDVQPINVLKQSGELIIPKSVTVIDGAIYGNHDPKQDDNAYIGWPVITSISIPNTVEAIDTIGITSTEITELIVPGSVKYIGVRAIVDNKKLKTLTIEKGCQHIDMMAFVGNTALTDVYLPSTIKKMSYNTADANPFGKSESNNSVNKKITIHAEKGSYAYNYCKDILGMNVVDTKQANAKPGKVASLKVSDARVNSMKLTWEKAKNADGYVIYQKSGSKWNPIKTTSKTNITVKSLKQNKKYQFKVVAYHSINGKTVSGKAATITKKTAKMKKPATVKNLKTSKVTKNAITLKWSKIKKDTTGYMVYQQKGKKWVKLDTVSAKKTSYRVTNLKGKTKYKFKIVTENKRAYGTSKSKAVTVNVKTK